MIINIRYINIAAVKDTYNFLTQIYYDRLCFVLLCCVGVQLTNYVIVIEKRNLMDFVSKMVCRPQTSGDDGDLEQEGRVSE